MIYRHTMKQNIKTQQEKAAQKITLQKLNVRNKYSAPIKCLIFLKILVEQPFIFIHFLVWGLGK